jgi:uncharacterized membrane protein
MNSSIAWRVLFYSSLSSIAACSSSGGKAIQQDAGPMTCSDAGTGTNFPCNVAPIIKNKCQRCHDTQTALTACLAANSCVQGPFPLTTWADTRRHLGPTSRVIDFMASVIETDVMPYQTDAISPPVEKLTADEKATLLSWAKSCAPASATACAP